MSEPVQPTIAKPTTPGQPAIQARPAPGRRSPLDVALILAGLIAIGGVAFAGGHLTGSQSAAAQNCGTGGSGGGGAPGAPEAPNAPGAPAGGGN